MTNRKYTIFLIGVFGILFALFIVGYAHYTRDRQRKAVEAYARVVENSLWNFEPQAPTDYLTLIVAEQDYEHLQVITVDGDTFVNVWGKNHNPLDNLLISLKLIPRVEIRASIEHEGEIIGEIKAIWLSKAIYVYFYVLILIALLMGVFWLYRRILQAKHELEIRVQKRTVELHDANIELRESEARYRSIFEDSPISLREEDFSSVKRIINALRLTGVQDFKVYFDRHPETLAECVRAVKVLNVNQNTLELFKAGNKEILYEGLTNIFTEKSLVSFGEQLIAFIEGRTHFECETIQQTLTGEKLWVSISVLIAPGYEETWAKVFVSILDISTRKRTEAELENHREHLAELVTARTTELVALQHDLERRVTERTEELAQVNVGLNAEIVERKRLQKQVQRYTEELEQRVADRTRELSVLYDVTAVASSVLDLDELLSRTLERSLTAMQRKAGAIHLLDEAEAKPRLATWQGISTDTITGIECLFSSQGGAEKIFEDHSPFIIPDLVLDSSVPQAVRRSGWRTYTGVPVQDTSGQLLGILSIFGETEQQLNVEEMTLLASIADHIGLAVENVRLRRQAEEAAVMEDRQRLARDLHDAVSQSLFSASVIAETLPRLWERNPVIVQQNLGELHRLIRGALAEMRTLLLELRPASMAEAVLSDLLRQLVDGITGRTQLDIVLNVEGQGTIPSRVKKNLFRIAQEALNNIAKHARAQHVVINLNQTVERIALYIGDDGQGFKQHRTEGSHLGLKIMRERAESIGATLTITSQPGRGTAIITIWPAESGGN